MESNNKIPASSVKEESKSSINLQYVESTRKRKRSNEKLNAKGGPNKKRKLNPDA
jgi:hypothetical protein